MNGINITQANEYKFLQGFSNSDVINPNSYFSANIMTRQFSNNVTVQHKNKSIILAIPKCLYVFENTKFAVANKYNSQYNNKLLQEELQKNESLKKKDFEILSVENLNINKRNLADLQMCLKNEKLISPDSQNYNGIIILTAKLRDMESSNLQLAIPVINIQEAESIKSETELQNITFFLEKNDFTDFTNRVLYSNNLAKLQKLYSQIIDLEKKINFDNNYVIENEIPIYSNLSEIREIRSKIQEEYIRIYSCQISYLNTIESICNCNINKK